MVKINERLKNFLMSFALLMGMKTNSSATPVSTGIPKPVAKETPDKQNQKETDYEAIQLDTIEDMYRLFDMSLNIIFAELVLEEVPMSQAYDDYGKYKGKKNTFGTGSTYSPVNISKDYNNPNATWYHLARNPKTFWTRTVSDREMLELVIGWAKYRTKTQNADTGKIITHKTVLERMFNELQGASLRPNEFAAIFCAVYNNENNIANLCPYIKDNCTDPIACANEIMTWYENVAANAGTKDRCEFESLVYLNADGFCSCIMDLYTKPLKKTGYSCINTTKVTEKQLTETNYKTYSQNALAEYKKVVYKGGVCTRDVCVNTKWGFTNPLPVHEDSELGLQKGYEEAIKTYRKGDYKTALQLFLDVEKQGASGADLWNDIAITYYKLKQYDKCIEYCQKILKTGSYGEYAKACYNAGLAYEAQGNYDKAIKNYEAALKHFDKYGISDQDPKVDYRRIYKAAKDRVTDAKKAATQSKQTKASKIKTGQQKVAMNMVSARVRNQIAMNRRNCTRQTRC